MDIKKEPFKIDLETDLRNALSEYRGDIRRIYPNSFLPENWVIDQDVFIRWIATCSLETNVRFREIALDGWSFVIKLPKKRLSKLVIWQSDYLLELARTKNYEEIKDLGNRHGVFGLWLGYFLLYLLPAIRLDRCFENNPDARDSFYSIKCSEILGSHSKTKPFLDKALENVSRPTQKIHRRITGQQLETDKVLGYIWEVGIKTLPESLKECFIRVANGDKAISFIPNSVKRDYLNENKKMLEAAIKERLILDSELTFKDGLKDDQNPEDLEELIDTQKLISQCLELINNPAILTGRERKVILMRYPFKDEKATLEETARELGIAFQTVQEIEKTALKKLFKYLNHPKTY